MCLNEKIKMGFSFCSVGLIFTIAPIHECSCWDKMQNAKEVEVSLQENEEENYAFLLWHKF